LRARGGSDRRTGEEAQSMRRVVERFYAWPHESENAVALPFRCAGSFRARCLWIGGGEGRRSFEQLVLVRSVQKVRAAADHDTAIACRIEAIQVTIAAIATTRSGCLRKWESCMARAPGSVGASIVLNRLAYCYRRNRHSLERAYFEHLNKAQFPARTTRAARLPHNETL
jgi:hypothetical protein